jgi:hypothetical protein
MSPTDPVVGRATPTDAASAFAAMTFVIRQHLSGRHVSMLVQVKAVTNDGGVTAVGTVDVQPLVSMVDGLGNATPPGTIYGMPYLRIQGGTNAIIIDPQVGDIGLAVVADRDISAVKQNKVLSTPSSSRQNSFSDGLYLGGFLNGVPQQYIQFQASGITVLSPNLVTIQAPNVTVQGNMKVTGTTELQGAVTADSTITASGEVQGNGIKLSTHVHGGVQTGGGNSGPPV